MFRSTTLAVLACAAPAWALPAAPDAASPQDGPPPPVISSIAILTPTVDVGRAPGQMRFAVTFTSKDTGLFGIGIVLRSPSGRQHVKLGTATPLEPHSGTVEVGNGRPLSLYSEPGLWTVTQVGAGNYQASGSLTPAQIAAVLQGPGVTVVNHGPVDTEKPSLVAGRVVTPTVSRSTNGPGEVKIALDAADNLSGIASVTVTAHTGTDPKTGYIQMVNDSPSFLLHGEYGVSYYAPELAPATYTVTAIKLCDNARNCLDVSDPNAIATLFDNQPSFTITP